MKEKLILIQEEAHQIAQKARELECANVQLFSEFSENNKRKLAWVKKMASDILKEVKEIEEG